MVNHLYKLNIFLNQLTYHLSIFLSTHVLFYHCACHFWYLCIIFYIYYIGCYNVMKLLKAWKISRIIHESLLVLGWRYLHCWMDRIMLEQSCQQVEYACCYVFRSFHHVRAKRKSLQVVYYASDNKSEDSSLSKKLKCGHNLRNTPWCLKQNLGQDYM